MASFDDLLADLTKRFTVRVEHDGSTFEGRVPDDQPFAIDGERLLIAFTITARDADGAIRDVTHADLLNGETVPVEDLEKLTRHPRLPDLVEEWRRDTASQIASCLASDDRCPHAARVGGVPPVQRLADWLDRVEQVVGAPLPGVASAVAGEGYDAAIQVGDVVLSIVTSLDVHRLDAAFEGRGVTLIRSPADAPTDARCADGDAVRATRFLRTIARAVRDSDLDAVLSAKDEDGEVLSTAPLSSWLAFGRAENPAGRWLEDDETWPAVSPEADPSASEGDLVAYDAVLRSILRD